MLIPGMQHWQVVHVCIAGTCFTAVLATPVPMDLINASASPTKALLAIRIAANASAGPAHSPLLTPVCIASRKA